MRVLGLVLVALCSGAGMSQGGAGAGGIGINPQDSTMGGDSRSANNLNEQVSRYLNVEPVKSILTPGEANEWPLGLKKGQVVIADASSEAFDPALEVTDGANKILASNDDRFAGDQRPLLLWHCDTDGSFKLKTRCFRDKAGGQFWLRVRVFDSVELPRDGRVSMKSVSSDPTLLRFHLKSGEVARAYGFSPDSGSKWDSHPTASIAPNGLPSLPVHPALGTQLGSSVFAPVEGDYYALVHGNWQNRGNAECGVEILKASPLTRLDGKAKSDARAGDLGLWSLSVKSGDLIELSVASLRTYVPLGLAVEPRETTVKDPIPGWNPFGPPPQPLEEDRQEAFRVLPSRFFDSNKTVFSARRDCTLWIACSGEGRSKSQYTLEVKPAASQWGSLGPSTGNLEIGDTRFFEYEAKVGEVLSLGAEVRGFASQIKLFSPRLDVIESFNWNPENPIVAWYKVVDTPGKYILSLTSIGGGGGGDYSLSRERFEPKTFKKGSPAKGDLSDGKAHVWSFTLLPNEPCLVHWTVSTWDLPVQIFSSDGTPKAWPTVMTDGQNQYGIVKVDKPTTFLIVMTPSASKSKYSIELLDLPGSNGG